MYYTNILNILIHILGIVNLIMLKLHDNLYMKELYYIIKCNYNYEYNRVLSNITMVIFTIGKHIRINIMTIICISIN